MDVPSITPKKIRKLDNIVKIGSCLTIWVHRSLTLTPGKMKTTEVASAPKLPDVRGCCVSAGVNHYGCVDKLCDPTKTFEIGVSSTIGMRDLIVFFGLGEHKQYKIVQSSKLWE